MIRVPRSKNNEPKPYLENVGMNVMTPKGVTSRTDPLAERKEDDQLIARMQTLLSAQPHKSSIVTSTDESFIGTMDVYTYCRGIVVSYDFSAVLCNLPSDYENCVQHDVHLQ